MRRLFSTAAVLLLAGCAAPTRDTGPTTSASGPPGQGFGVTGSPGQASEATITMVANEFRAAMASGGMIATTRALRSDYRTALAANDNTQLLQCALWDVSAMYMDRSFRRSMTQSGGADPGPSVPFLAPDAFSARMELVDRRVFRGDREALHDFIGGAPADVLREVSR